MVTSERSTAYFLFLAASFGYALRSLAKTSYASHGEAQGLLRTVSRSCTSTTRILGMKQATIWDIIV